MKVVSTRLDGVLVIEPAIIQDERGLLFESFNSRAFAEITDRKPNFVQDNISRSQRNVIRGLHYQKSRPQGKLVQAVVGAVFDVAVDMRKGSATYGKWLGVELSSENRRQLWVPEGFAHGFLAISSQAEVYYKLTDYWSPDDECTIAWNDPTLNIAWPLQGMPILSPKDKQGVWLDALPV